MSDRQHLFAAGTAGYHTYRIPALVTTMSGTVLAFCEGRVHGRGDAGEIHLLLRRSHDGGASWGPVQVIVAAAGMTSGNPGPVLCRETGVVWLPFTRNPGDRTEDMICRGDGSRTVWLTRSADDGATWAPPREITADVKRADWTWYATGPGYGIQLASGRLVVPCDHIVGRRFDRRTDPYHAHVILSDDRGATWRIGGIVGEGTNECTVAELADRSIYLNARGALGTHRRAVAWSEDGGESFGERDWDAVLVEPMCQGSLIGMPGGPILFVNPASTTRDRLTLRASHDGGRAWRDGPVLHPGPSAYSDLTLLPDGSVLCLYEGGDDSPYEHLTLARLDAASMSNA